MQALVGAAYTPGCPATPALAALAGPLGLLAPAAPLQPQHTVCQHMAQLAGQCSAKFNAYVSPAKLMLCTAGPCVP